MNKTTVSLKFECQGGVTQRRRKRPNPKSLRNHRPTPAPSHPLAPSATPRSDEAASGKDDGAADLADGGECQGEDITVESSMDSPVNLTGDCGVITLSGEGIVLEVESAKGIVDKSGKSGKNTVTTSTAESVWVAGDGNTVMWEKPLSTLPETVGSANTLTGPQ
ncbi:hypothetical protein [Arthrobacter roseus]|uniref:hypothetical protein n=1 Tax=Arthrobacter roseus TaxID=136274 RepID=UPI001964CB71|nr:hypothetical protein [Arthrobacter roseus]MBM7849690.1 hypothetical protein [Arthrobacter roseus]